VTPEQWQALTPEQQAWHLGHMAPPPPPVKPGPNIAAIISLSSGLLAFLVLPILLGPAAVIAGVVGNTVAVRSKGPGGRMSAAGIVLGLIAVLIFLSRVGGL
jgi:hypothetical protein